MPFNLTLPSGCIDDVTKRIKNLEQKIEIIEFSHTMKEVMNLDKNIDNILIIGIDKEKVIKYYDRPHEIRLELFKSMLKTLKIEKQVYISYANKKNKEIFSKLSAKYAEEQGHTLEKTATLVELGDMPEGDYIDYAKTLKRQYEYIKSICDVGKM